MISRSVLRIRPPPFYALRRQISHQPDFRQSCAAPHRCHRRPMLLPAAMAALERPLLRREADHFRHWRFSDLPTGVEDVRFPGTELQRPANVTRRANQCRSSNLLSSPFRKNILIFRRRKSPYIRSRPAPLEGRLAYRHETRGGMRWSPRTGAFDEGWRRRGRRSRVVLTPRRWCQASRIIKSARRRWQESPVTGESTKGNR